MNAKWTYRYACENFLENAGFFPSRGAAEMAARQNRHECDDPETPWFEVGRVELITAEDLSVDPRDHLDLELAQRIAESLENAVISSGAVDDKSGFVEHFGDADLEAFLFQPYREMIAAHLETHPLYRVVDVERHSLDGAA